MQPSTYKQERLMTDTYCELVDTMKPDYLFSYSPILTEVQRWYENYQPLTYALISRRKAERFNCTECTYSKQNVSNRDQNRRKLF